MLALEREFRLVAGRKPPMKKLTPIIAAGALLAATAGSAYACPWASAKYDSASTQDITIAETPANSAQSEAVSTFDPTILKPEEKAE